MRQWGFLGSVEAMHHLPPRPCEGCAKSFFYLNALESAQACLGGICRLRELRNFKSLRVKVYGPGCDVHAPSLREAKAELESFVRNNEGVSKRESAALARGFARGVLGFGFMADTREDGRANDCFARAVEKYKQTMDYVNQKLLKRHDAKDARVRHMRFGGGRTESTKNARNRSFHSFIDKRPYWPGLGGIKHYVSREEFYDLFPTQEEFDLRLKSTVPAYDEVSCTQTYTPAQRIDLAKPKGR
eukprot:g37401.t1